jgi:hypothetical protein
MIFALGLTAVLAADDTSDDTPLAAATRKKLKEKVTCDYKDTRLEDVVDDLKEQIKGLRMQLDSKGGVSRNMTFTFACKDKPLDEALDELLKKTDLGYIIISKKGNAYDGSIQIRKGKERGVPRREGDK